MIIVAFFLTVAAIVFFMAIVSLLTMVLYSRKKKETKIQLFRLRMRQHDTWLYGTAITSFFLAHFGKPFYLNSSGFGIYTASVGFFIVGLLFSIHYIAKLGCLD